MRNVYGSVEIEAESGESRLVGSKCLSCGAVSINCDVDGCSSAPCNHIGFAGTFSHSIDCPGPVVNLNDRA